MYLPILEKYISLKSKIYEALIYVFTKFGKSHISHKSKIKKGLWFMYLPLWKKLHYFSQIKNINGS